MSRIGLFKSLFNRTALFFGYTTVVFSWLWIGALVLPGIIDSEIFSQPTKPSITPIAPVVHIEASPLTTTLAVGLMVIVLTITIIMLIRIPRSVTRKADTVVQNVSMSVIPVITHHQKLTPSKERTLRIRISLGVQLILLLIPGLLTLIVPVAGELTRSLIVVVGSTLFLSGSVWFGLAYLTKSTVTSRTR